MTVSRSSAIDNLTESVKFFLKKTSFLTISLFRDNKKVVEVDEFMFSAVACDIFGANFSYDRYKYTASIEPDNSDLLAKRFQEFKNDLNTAIRGYNALFDKLQPTLFMVLNSSLLPDALSYHCHFIQEVRHWIEHLKEIYYNEKALFANDHNNVLLPESAAPCKSSDSSTTMKMGCSS